MSDRVHTINCPACGAPIDFSESEAKTHCPFCGSTVERPRTAPPAVKVSISPQPSVRARTRSRGCISPLVLGLVILLAAGGVFFFLATPKGPGSNILVGLSRSVQGAVIPVPSDRQGPDDVLVLTYDSTSEQSYLTYVDGLNHTLRWDSPPMSNGAYAGNVLVANGKVLLVDKAVLMALNESDGKVLWQTNLSDSVGSSCQGCVQVLEGYAITLSQDGTLQAFEVESGRPAWSERLNETPSALWAVNGKVAVVDYQTPNESDSVALQLRDPATGKMVRAIPGACEQEYRSARLSIYEPNVLVGPTGGDVYLLFGLLPGCAQRWNPETGQQVWQTVAEDHYLDRFTAPPILTSDAIYASYNGRIIAVNTADGKLRLVDDEEDYELSLQGEREGLLLILARRLRGSTRYELWGMNAADGRVAWTYVPLDEQPVESPGGWAADKAFAWHLTRDGLVVLHLFAQPPMLTVDALDMKTGQPTVLGAASLDDDYWAGLAWSNDTAWLTIRKVYTIDLVSGQVLSTWP